MDVCVGYVEGGVQGLKASEGEIAAGVAICSVDFFVFASVSRSHIPVEAIFEPGGIVVVGGGGDRGKRGLRAAEGAGGLDEVGFRFGNEPVRKGGGDIGVFL